MQTVDLPWERIARQYIHPRALAIIEFMVEYGEPVSPLTAFKAFDGAAGSFGDVSYHFRALRDKGLIEPVRTKQVRGAVQHFYALALGT
jgi:hypothetical protein